MLIDEVKVVLSGGKGGDGMVAFDHSKFSQGPSGGAGGNGGSVYMEGVSNLNALNQFRNQKSFSAEDGEKGKSRRLDGANGEDLILKVPVGTVMHNLDTGKDAEIIKVGERILVARGGKGGRGNWYFRSSVNIVPREFEMGAPGGKFNFLLELRLIADIGLIGLPNAGKTSMLNALTKANARVAAYPFTTLEPNLGDFYGVIIADIPGLIEGAAGGKGLGTKFLRHIKRTKVLFHCISLESEDPIKDYKTVRDEMEKYAPSLISKPEYIFLTKNDVVDKKIMQAKVRAMKKINPQVLAISIHEEKSMEKVKKLINKLKLH